LVRTYGTHGAPSSDKDSSGDAPGDGAFSPKKESGGDALGNSASSPEKDSGGDAPGNGAPSPEKDFGGDAPGNGARDKSMRDLSSRCASKTVLIQGAPGLLTGAPVNCEEKWPCASPERTE